jgi:signal transduction histidine kinase
MADAIEARMDASPSSKSLRRLFWQAGALFSALVVAAVAAFLASTAYLQSMTQRLGTTLESLRLAEDVQEQLLLHQHAKTLELLVGSEAHAREAVDVSQRLTHLVDWASGHASSAEERDLLLVLRSSVQEYLSSASKLRSTGSVDWRVTERLADRFDDAFGKVQSVIQLDLDLAHSQRRHADLQRIAGITAGSITVVLLVMFVLFGRSLRKALFVPLDRLSEAIRGYPADRSRRAPEVGSRELQQIGRTFNLVASDLQAQRENQLSFLGGIAHDLRNPLGALRGAFTILNPDRPLPDQARLRRILHVARRSVDRLNTMVEDLLDISRAELGRLSIVPGECDLRDIVRDTAVLFDSTGASVESVLPDVPVPAWCDAGRIMQVLTNLVSNAIKYSPEGSTVRIAACADDGAAVLEVSDAGIGVPPEELNRIFEPFRRSSLTKSSIPGVGLGLFISKQLVETHGGQLTVASTPGKDSTFRITLPPRP